MEQRKNLESQAREVLDLAESEKRDLSAEENVKFDKINADMNALRSRADKLVEFDADTRAAEEALRKAGISGGEQRGGTGEDTEMQLRSFLRGESRKFEVMGTKDELRALAKGTPTAGGNTVPTTFYGQLIEHLVESATMLSAGATVLTTTSGETIDLPVTTSHGSAAQVAEGGKIGGSDPAFGKRSLSAYKYGQLIEVPKELIDDTGVDLEGYLARVAGRNVGNALGEKLITGTGVSEPGGIIGSSLLGKTGSVAVAGVPNFDDLIDLFYSVIGSYRNSPNAGWLIKDTTAGSIRKLKDLSGRYIWEASTVAGQPDLILAKPVYTDPFMPATGVGAKSVAFGDISSYFVRIVNGVRFESSEHFKFDSDVVTFRALVRGDGVLADQTGAVKHFLGGAAA